MIERYFAYGSNINQSTMRELVPSSKCLGAARLDNYRLAFTRLSKKTQAGVADIVTCPGMSVWGTLYELDNGDLARIDAKEGYPNAYGRSEIEVAFNEGLCTAFAYTVRNKAPAEFQPGREYLDRIISAASEQEGIPGPYIAFLNHLRSRNEDDMRSGLLVRGTSTRTGAKGATVVRVSRSFAKRRGLGSYCAVELGDLVVVAKVIRVHDKQIPEGVCELDQNLRRALGMRALQTYGYRVDLHLIENSVPRYWFIRPRWLSLAAQRPYWLDSEKNISVLHENNIALLGLEEGQYAKLLACVRCDQPRSYLLKKVDIRLFGGSTSKLGLGTSAERDYPKPDEIYVDRDIRERLDLPKGILGYPLVVMPAVGRLFANRLLFYGITLFLGAEAILRFAAAVGIFVHISQRTQAIGSAIVALAATLGLAVVDLRAKLRF